MGGGAVDQIGAQPPLARKRTLLVGAGEPAVADNIGGPDRSNLPGFRHGRVSGYRDGIMNDALALMHGPSERRGCWGLRPLSHAHESNSDASPPGRLSGGRRRAQRQDGIVLRRGL
jgi:hypothetical protein